LKIELIAYLYHLSEWQAEEYVNENLPARFFVGLAVDQAAPDHSTLTVFREQLLKRGKLQMFEAMLVEIVAIALSSGIHFGSIQVVDSVHSVANVNVAKDSQRQKNGKGPRDPDARWGAKHKHKVKDEEGQEIEQTEYFYGYKAHVSLNAESGLITSLETTSGEVYDGKHFRSLVDHDMEQQLPVDMYTADKAYDDSENHLHLKLRGPHSAIRLKRTRTEKKDANKQVWLNLSDTRSYRQGLAER
jgi:IS5 family transposase